VVLCFRSYVNGLKEAPQQNSVPAVLAEIWNRVKRKSFHTYDRLMKIIFIKLKGILDNIWINKNKRDYC
jgi:hypothetical protein